MPGGTFEDVRNLMDHHLSEYNGLKFRVECRNSIEENSDVDAFIRQRLG